MSHNCSEDEICKNQPGGFRCKCHLPGFHKTEPWGLCEGEFHACKT